jgi:hypothetical protein
VAAVGTEWFEVWKKPVIRQVVRIWVATAFLDEALPSKEGARSISGTVGSCDSGTLGGGFVRAPVRRLRRWIGLIGLRRGWLGGCPGEGHLSRVMARARVVGSVLRSLWFLLGAWYCGEILLMRVRDRLMGGI